MERWPSFMTFFDWARVFVTRVSGTLRLNLRCASALEVALPRGRGAGARRPTTPMEPVLRVFNDAGFVRCRLGPIVSTTPWAEPVSAPERACSRTHVGARRACTARHFVLGDEPPPLLLARHLCCLEDPRPIGTPSAGSRFQGSIAQLDPHNRLKQRVNPAGAADGLRGSSVRRSRRRFTELRAGGPKARS